MDEKEIKATLLGRFGSSCWGCTETLSERYLVLDHIVPKADGGSDEIYNRALLCDPCNRKKGDRLTLSALRRDTKAKEHSIDLKGALKWTQGEFLKGLVIPLQLFTTETQDSRQSEEILPAYEGNGVQGLRELRLLLHVQGHEDIAKALKSVVSFQAFRDGWNGEDTYIEMTVANIPDFNFLNRGISEDDKQDMWEAVCAVERVNMTDNLFPKLWPHVAEVRGMGMESYNPKDDIDDLPF